MPHTTPIGSPARALRAALLAVAIAALLAACGGGAGSSAGGAAAPDAGSAAPITPAPTPTPTPTPDPTPSPAPPTLTTRADAPEGAPEAARFLTQATFGPTDADVARVRAIGFTAWLNEQIAKPGVSHLATFQAADAAVKAAGGSNAFHEALYSSFWKHAITADDQLRQRVAFALSQIFVVSIANGVADVRNQPAAVTAYMDLLSANAFGNYRELLEAVSLNPMMATFLSSLRNEKADPVTGRIPDENYAREVMQLFSIGLYQLNLDGSLKRGTDGQPLPTYGPADVAGMARVFTGWSWHCASGSTENCWTDGNNPGDPNLTLRLKSLTGYPERHSIEAKTFLGVTLPAQSTPDPRASLKFALDTLHKHPNVGPFIGKQLIQRLVTSNPSPAYVATVAAAFNDNGSGVRGDMKAVIRAIFMHPEAKLVSSTSGKLREPILRLSAFLRAFSAKSTRGTFLINITDNPGTELGQSAMTSPSVFNFYRPGYVPPGTLAAGQAMVVPEMQITHETSVAGYVNFMLDVVKNGIGASYDNLHDVQPDYSAELPLADRPADLVARLNDKLMYGGMPAALKTEIVDAITTLPLAASSAGATALAESRRKRVKAAVFLTVISPEFQVQK